MTSQPYAGAARHLVAAGRARLAIARGWDELHGEDGTGNTAVPRTAIMDNGAGLIRVVSSLTEQDLERLTSSFKLMIDGLLSCLDSLVAESVTVFSAVLSEQRPVGVEPYFPIAATQEDFEELLKEGHLFGVLRTQARMVMDCQPFKTAPGGEVLDACRRALGLLLDWSQRLEDGVQIDTWVTPVEPKVRVGEGGRVTDLEPCPAGLLGEARDVATFRIEGYQPGMRVDARAGSYIDLTYPDGIPPADEADTFGSRVKLVFEVVERFLGTFHALARQGPVQPEVLQAVAADKDVWTPALDAGRGWTEAEIQQIQDSDFGVGVVLDEGELTLVVTTPAGIFERRVPAAAPLADRKNHGTAAEDATHEAVATWGIPDFVIKPLVEMKGSATREVGDGLLLVGDKGVVIQVKSRERPGDNDARERSWIAKKIAEGTRQVSGTARSLGAKVTTVTNGRGRGLKLDGSKVSWTGVVIIDHPSPPESFELAQEVLPVPTVVLLRRDWEFLFHQLKSTYAVVDYLRRVETSAEELGGEPFRYFELAAADLEAESPPLSFELKAPAVRVSAPRLPSAPAGVEDPLVHACSG